MNAISLLTVDKVAEMLDVSNAFIYKLVRTNQLPAVKIGAAVRIRPSDLDKFIELNFISDGNPIWASQSGVSQHPLNPTSKI